MITTLPPKNARSPKPARTAASGRPTSTQASDYQVLGLRQREARVEVIREAVHQAANNVQLENAARLLESAVAEELESRDDSELRLTEIAVAGYRLLDPRRRRTLFERVQLLMWTEEELDSTIKSMWAVEPSAPPKVTIALRSNTPSEPTTSSSPAEETQVALELFRTMRTRDRRATALWIGLIGLSISLIAALVN